MKCNSIANEHIQYPGLVQGLGAQHAKKLVKNKRNYNSEKARIFHLCPGPG